MLMLVNRAAGLVLPATSKWLMDDVVAKGRWDLLSTLAFAAGSATLVESASSFALSRVLGVAAQRAITDMRRQVEAHVMRLPIRYFDSTKTGILISRVMTDAEGIRNLVGTGLVQLAGSMVTALVSFAILFYLNWRLTTVTLFVLGAFGGGLADGVRPPAAALPRTRSDQRRSDRTARRNAQRRPHRQGLHGREARGARLHPRRSPAVQERRAVADGCIDRDGVFDARPRCDWRRDDHGRRFVHPLRRDDRGRVRHVSDVHRLDGAAGHSAGLHRHPDLGGLRRTRSHSRDPADGHRRRRGCEPRRDARRPRRGRVRRRDVRVQRRRAGAEARVIQGAGRLHDGARRVERIRARARSSRW